jgi:hypothetical protein
VPSVHWCASIASGSIRALLLADLAWTGSAVDARMLAYATLAALVTGLLTSLLPALQASRAELTSALKAGAREGSFGKSRVRTTLLVSQAALAIVLLSGAALFVASLQNVGRLSLGVDINRVLTADVAHASVGMTNAEAREMFKRFDDAAKRVPGISHTATSVAMSFGVSWSVSLARPGREAPLVANNRASMPSRRAT